MIKLRFSGGFSNNFMKKTWFIVVLGFVILWVFQFMGFSISIFNHGSILFSLLSSINDFFTFELYDLSIHLFISVVSPCILLFVYFIVNKFCYSFLFLFIDVII